MEYFKLHNGVEMPMLGMGISQIPSDTDGVGVVVNAINAGFRHFDTAEYYGNEDMLGEGIRKSSLPRQDIFVTTKVHNQAQTRPNGVQEAFEASLDKLGLDYIDLYLVHWPLPGYWIEAYKKLEEIYRSGKTRAIGVCNLKIHHLQELEKYCEILPMVNQYEHHPYLTQPEIREYYQQKGILITAYCPLGRGRLGLMDNPTIAEIARKHGKTPAQVILRWNMDLGVSAITKTVTPSRMAENFNIFDFNLDKTDIETINALNNNTRVIRDPDDPESYTGSVHL
ncbi:MAG: aldo/keto reductase [Defluviitaleaceae bacterium]|nr:aldo/keto reductase [Defluviitaleaceae bacterium]